MLFPDKHIRLSESLLGLSSFVLDSLHKPKNIDSLWQEFQIAKDGGIFPASHNIENLILAVDFLFMIDLVKVNDVGEIYR